MELKRIELFLFLSFSPFSVTFFTLERTFISYISFSPRASNTVPFLADSLDRRAGGRAFERARGRRPAFPHSLCLLRAFNKDLLTVPASIHCYRAHFASIQEVLLKVGPREREREGKKGDMY